MMQTADVDKKILNMDFYVPSFDIYVGGEKLGKEVQADIIEISYTDNLESLDSFRIILNNWDIEKRTFKYLDFNRNPFNLGKGRALRKALHYISGDYVVFLDADMDLHPIQVQTLFDIMRLDNADIIIGSKLHPNSIVKYPFQRRFISRVYYWLVKILFNLPCHDTQTGLKLFKAEVLQKVFHRILVKKFAFDLEILVNAHHLGYHITEAPIVLNSQRRYGRIGPKAVFTTFWDTLAIFYRMHILKYYDRIDYYRRKNLAKEFRRMRR